MIYFLAIIITCLLSYCLFPSSLSVSKLVGAIDYPTIRKSHTKPTPRAGGIAFFLAFSVAFIIIPANVSLKIPLILGGAVIFLVGFSDDAVNIAPFVKLSGQALALTVYHFTAEFLQYDLSIFQSILTSVWIIFISNATNIIDGLDGLCAGVSSCEALCIGVLALILGNTDVMICSFLLMGAIVGFLPNNFPKAKIFMGDCGALFLGFTLAVLSARLVIESGSLLCLLSILLIFRLPLYDTNFSIIRRIARRKSPFKADKNHFHHILVRNGFTKECASLLLITLSLFCGFCGIIISLI